MNRYVRLAQRLRDAKYSVIELAAVNGQAPVEVLLISTKRREVPTLLSLVQAIDPAPVVRAEELPHPVAADRRKPESVDN